jgi:NAD(P)-dependent dehydrogenase (short-subunit alcohol dehydrogenase family)
MRPEDQLPRQDYKLSLTDPEGFKAKMLTLLGALPKEAAGGMAYIISKNFVVWYSAQCACLYGRKGIRVLSVSPGVIKTAMGEIETSGHAPALQGALGRLGEPEELAQLLAFCASDKASYLAGTDILCDGGTIAAMRRAAEK